MSEQLADAVVESLGEIHGREGARRALGAVTAALEDEIRTQNVGTGWVQ